MIKGAGKLTIIGNYKLLSYMTMEGFSALGVHMYFLGDTVHKIEINENNFNESLKDF